MLYRRHTQARKVPSTDRVVEGGDGGSTTTSADLQGKTRDGEVSPDEHSLDELKAMAAELDVATSGTKAELAERINAKLAE